MSRRLFALLAVALAAVALADDKPPVVPPEPEYDCRFDDGSVVRLTVGVSAVDVKTRFGTVTVPLADARKVEMGFRYPDGLEAKVRRAVDDLGSPDFRTREAAQKVLVGCGEYAVPLVKAGTANAVPEVAERCAAVLKAVTAALPDDKSDPVMEDVITTAEMVIRGKITTDTFKARSKYFGDTAVKLVDVRELRPVGGRFVGTFALDADKYGVVGWKTFLDTGLDVEKGQLIEISTTGTITVQTASPGPTKCGPAGCGTQVPGPGQHLVEGGGKLGGLAAPGLNTNIEGYGQLHASGALYGRIGANGKLFKIGEKLTVPKAEGAGRLYLVVAPSDYGASKGEFAVKVKLGK